MIGMREKRAGPAVQAFELPGDRLDEAKKSGPNPLYREPIRLVLRIDGSYKLDAIDECLIILCEQ